MLLILSQPSYSYQYRTNTVQYARMVGVYQLKMILARLVSYRGMIDEQNSLNMHMNTRSVRYRTFPCNVLCTINQVHVYIHWVFNKYFEPYGTRAAAECYRSQPMRRHCRLRTCWIAPHLCYKRLLLLHEYVDMPADVHVCIVLYLFMK